MKYFFDNSISFRIAHALRILDEGQHQIIALRDWQGAGGDPSVADEDFLPVLKSEGGWVVVTADRGRKDANWHVWLASGLTVVFLRPAWNKLVLHEQAHRMLKHWPALTEEVTRHPEGTCLYLHPTGRMDLVPRRRRRRRRG